jgi:cobalt/nickel transport system permease protein
LPAYFGGPLSRANFLDKTLLSVAHVAEQSLFSEAYARRRGLLQSLDVRIKLVGFLCIIVLLSFLHAPQSLWIAYAFSLLLAACSGISLRFFIKRVWLFVPLFSAAIVLPALLNIITPGDPMLVLVKLSRSYAWGPYSIPAELAVTRQGLWGGIVFVSRVATSVSFAVLLTLTTKWAEIFSGLRSLFIPRIFIVTLSMTERYLFVLLRLIQDMYRGRLSRTIKPLSPAVERNWIASRIGVTFKKSMEMSEDVYKAMLSRGFHGEFRTISRFRATFVDYLWLSAISVAGCLLVMLDKGWTR